MTQSEWNFANLVPRYSNDLVVLCDNITLDFAQVECLMSVDVAVAPWEIQEIEAQEITGIEAGSPQARRRDGGTGATVHPTTVAS